TVFTNPLWEAIRDRQDAFSGVFGYSGTEFNLTAGGEIRRANGTWVSGDYFSTLGVRPALGRLLVRADDVRGCQPVAVLGYGFWQSEYGGGRAGIWKKISPGPRPPTFFGAPRPSR